MDDGTLIVKTKIDTDGVDEGLKEVEKKAEKSSGKASTAFSGIKSAAVTGLKVAGAAIGAATTAMAGFAGASVQAGQEFDSAMSQVAATMGKTTDELNNEIVKVGEFEGSLRDFAQEMGSTTAFSATEAAEALNYMALAGYDATTSVEMLPNVLNLAAAGGMELAAASDMVTDAQTALGLSIDDTTALVDKMAKASSKSNTSVSQLGDAILTIGGNAKSLAGGTTELATTLGVLADNGIKGSEAGTHLRNIMLAMNPTTDAAAEAWKQLGVSAYDTDGNLRPLQDTFLDLSKAMDGMSTQKRTETLSNLFNKTDLASINALLDTQAGRWTELGAAIDDSVGSAEQMANTQLDNLAGDITLFQSALEGTKIAVSEGLTPTIREFVQFGSEGLSNLTTAFKEDGLNGAMEAFGQILTEGLNMIVAKLPELVEAGAQLLGSLVQGIMDNLPQIAQTALEIITTLAADIGESLPELIPQIVEIILQIVDTLLDNIDLLIDAAIGIITGLAEGLINSLPVLIEKAPEIIMKLVTALIDAAPKLMQAAATLIVTLAKGLAENLPKLLTEIPKLIYRLAMKIQDCKKDMIEAGKNLVAGLGQGLNDAWGRFVENTLGKAKELIKSVCKVFGIESPSKEFKYIGEMCVAGLDQPLEDYNPYETVENSFQASAGTLQASFAGGYSGFNFSMDGLGDQVASAIQGMGVYIDGRTAGSLVAASVNNTLGRINNRRT